MRINKQDLFKPLVIAIMDLQFGSTGKGSIAGYLAKSHEPDVVVTSWAANAGHTFIDGETGKKYVHTMLANGVISENLKHIVLGAGSLLNLDNLLKELIECKDLINRHGKLAVTLHIHSSAAVILPCHVEAESTASSTTSIGSTKKGVGEAMVDRVRRDVNRPNTVGQLWHTPIMEEFLQKLTNAVEGLFVSLASSQDLVEVYNNAQTILVEGAQGHSLSMYHGFYPYCTSRDVSIAQMMADNCIPPSLAENMMRIGTLRTFPIRVANRFSESGEQIGTSGRGYDDQKEISFEAIGQKVELTTVTQLPRRIFTFSRQQIYDAVQMNSIDYVFLNFANYLADPLDLMNLIKMLQNRVGVKVGWIGFGATDKDIINVGDNEDYQQIHEDITHLKCVNYAQHNWRILNEMGIMSQLPAPAAD